MRGTMSVVLSDNRSGARAGAGKIRVDKLGVCAGADLQRRTQALRGVRSARRTETSRHGSGDVCSLGTTSEGALPGSPLRQRRARAPSRTPGAGTRAGEIAHQATTCSASQPRFQIFFPVLTREAGVVVSWCFRDAAPTSFTVTHRAAALGRTESYG